jgi:hypothetical protein
MSKIKALQALVNETVLNAKYVERFGEEIEPEVNTILLLVKHLTALQASSTFALKRAENLSKKLLEEEK